MHSRLSDDFRKHKKRKRATQTLVTPQKPHSRPLSKPSLALQGLTASARAQLLALSLLTLEKQADGLPSDFVRSDMTYQGNLALRALHLEI